MVLYRPLNTTKLVTCFELDMTRCTVRVKTFVDYVKNKLEAKTKRCWLGISVKVVAKLDKILYRLLGVLVSEDRWWKELWSFDLCT